MAAIPPRLRARANGFTNMQVMMEIIIKDAIEYANIALNFQVSNNNAQA